MKAYIFSKEDPDGDFCCLDATVQLNMDADVFTPTLIKNQLRKAFIHILDNNDVDVVITTE